MCYSAQIQADYTACTGRFGATMDIEQFVRLFWKRRKDGKWNRIPKAMRDGFRRPGSKAGFELAKLVADGDHEYERSLRAEREAQAERLVRAETVLAGSKPTKKAANDQRIATGKIAAAERNLAALQRREPAAADARIYPGLYAPVLVAREGVRTVEPMRYQCRMPGWSAQVERKYPGTYNARRDKLEASWSQLFGYRHGILVISRFFENVARHKVEGRELAPGEKESNVVLAFDPQPPQEMLVACLWNASKGADDGDDLLTFAAITDEPPPEVAAAGHDRCIVPIKPEHVDAWLTPDPDNLEALHAILDDRARPYYAHQLAA